MQDLQLVIPTHGRPNKQTTLCAIPENLRDEVLLVVSTQEDYDIIRKFHKNTRIAPVDSIATKRQWIMENVKARKILMFDDDMSFQARCPIKFRSHDGARWRIAPGATEAGHYLLAQQYATPQYITKMLSEVSNKLDKYAHVGISSRMGNDLVDSMWKDNTRMMHAIGFDRLVFKKEKLRFNEVRFREDFNVTLHLLRRGYANRVLYDLCVSPGSYGAPGGASSERTVEASNAEAEKLAAIHPGFVRVVDKDYKGVPRKEVACAWKKAYESSKA